MYTPSWYDADATLPLPFIFYNIYCIAEPLAGVAFALQSGPVIGPQLGPVSYCNTGRSTGHGGVFPSSTATVGDTVGFFSAWKRDNEQGTTTFRHSTSPPSGFLRHETIIPAFQFLLQAVMQGLWVF